MSKSKLKTIGVVYTERQLTAKGAAGLKVYYFNTAEPVERGDMLKSPEYATPMQVVVIKKTAYKYVHRPSNELSNNQKCVNDPMWLPLRELYEAETCTPVPRYAFTRL